MAEAYNSAYKGSEIDAAVKAVREKENAWDGKQDALSGDQGQFVGFDGEGKPESQNVTADNVKFSDGETFQQKYDSGELTGPAGADGADGQDGAPGADGAQGPAGAAGKDATINGVNALTLEAGDNVQMSQAGSVLTISAKPKFATVTLTAAGWISTTAGTPENQTGSGQTGSAQQTVTVSGVSADETAQLIQPMPSAASQATYIEAGILCTGQGANSLTFSCETAPTADLTVYVVITEVKA